MAFFVTKFIAKGINKRRHVNFFAETWLKILKKYFALILSFVLFMSTTLQISAAESAVGTLSNCTITISCRSDGVGISVTTSTSTTADVIGVKDIVLQEKVNGVWKDINIGGDYTTDNDLFSGSALYSSAVKGRTYRAYCTHYATWGSTTKTLYNETGEMVYN